MLRELSMAQQGSRRALKSGPSTSTASGGTGSDRTSTVDDSSSCAPLIATSAQASERSASQKRPRRPNFAVRDPPSQCRQCPQTVQRRQSQSSETRIASGGRARISSFAALHTSVAASSSARSHTRLPSLRPVADRRGRVDAGICTLPSASVLDARRARRRASRHGGATPGQRAIAEPESGASGSREARADPQVPHPPLPFDGSREDCCDCD